MKFNQGGVLDCHSAGIDCRCQIMTSKNDPRTEGLIKLKR